VGAPAMGAGRTVPGDTRWELPLPDDPDAVATAAAQLSERYSGAALSRLMRFMGMVTLEWEAHGAVLRDVHGREYVECGGYGQFLHGHSHPRVVAAVRRQAGTLALSSRLLPHLPQAEAAERLAAVCPGDLTYSFFCNSGAEAVEGALKLARAATGRQAVLAAQGAFHGKTFGALTASGKALYRDPFLPLVGGFHHVPYGDAGALERAAAELSAAPGGLAAIVLEPIQGEAGVVVPPPGYLQAARAVCDRLGALLILDEVQTGVGRTGTMFACEHEGVVPDILATAKSLGGGVMPVGAFVARPSCWAPFDENPYLHTSTFGGSPLACAAVVAALEAVAEEDLLGAARRHEATLRQGLGEIGRRHPAAIAAVRGRGLLWGLELRSEGIGGLVLSTLLEAGVLVVHSLNEPRVIRVMPPAVIGEDQLAFALEAIDRAAAAAAVVAEELL
jgi:putrescine aminotransferase